MTTLKIALIGTSKFINYQSLTTDSSLLYEHVYPIMISVNDRTFNFEVVDYTCDNDIDDLHDKELFGVICVTCYNVVHWKSVINDFLGNSSIPIIMLSKAKLNPSSPKIICIQDDQPAQYNLVKLIEQLIILTPTEIKNGNRYWLKYGIFHRDHDLPAAEYANGDKYWYKEGKRHRDNDLPAVECADGTKHWYKDGKLHRDNDLPATIYSTGDKHWLKEGKRHRDNDLPAVEYANGDKMWYKNDTYYTPNNPHKMTFDEVGTNVQSDKQNLLPFDVVGTLVQSDKQNLLQQSVFWSTLPDNKKMKITCEIYTS